MGVISLDKYKYNKIHEYYCINLKICKETKCTKSSYNINLKPSLTCSFYNRNCPASTFLAYIDNGLLTKNDIIEYCINELNINSIDLVILPAKEMIKIVGAEFDKLYNWLMQDLY